MGQQNPKYLDEKLVEALKTLNFDKERLAVIQKYPCYSYPQLARRIMHVFLIQPELRTEPAGHPLQKILFKCLNHVTNNEFKLAMQELETFYLSDTPSLSFKNHPWLDNLPSVNETSSDKNLPKAQRKPTSSR